MTFKNSTIMDRLLIVSFRYFSDYFLF